MKKYINGQYVEMTAEEVAEMKEQAKTAYYEEMNKPLTTEEKIRMVVESIPQMDKPQNRDGYLWIPIYDRNNNVFGWTEVKDEFYVPTEDGSYINPFMYADGMKVMKGYWYKFSDGNVWECIKTEDAEGKSQYTKEYFDII